jgi:hypothetical protein
MPNPLDIEQPEPLLRDLQAANLIRALSGAAEP